MTRSLPGPFTLQNLGHGVWQLASEESEVYLTLAGPESAGLPGIFGAIAVSGADTSRAAKAARPDTGIARPDAKIARLDIDWRAGGVIVGLGSGTEYGARSAIVHEPRAALYDDLGLASFDAEAKRFWRRIFGLMRIPGGRFLLRHIARRKR